MKIFEYEEKRGFKIYRILGIKFSIRIKKKVAELEKEIELLRNIMNYCIDITKIPPAKGKKREIQLEILELLIAIKGICERNNLNYWIDSGTLLGAVRHKGYIPWDDDIDICMPREDYERIIPLLKKEFENTVYCVRERAKTVNNFQIRIMRQKNRKIGLDIFPVDKYFMNASDEEKEIITAKIKKAQRVFQKKYKNKVFTDELIKEAKKELLKIQSNIVTENRQANCDSPTLFLGIDYPHSYKNLAFDYETVFPLKQIEFENEKFNCPNDYDKYLTNFYGNYMKLPDKISYE